LEVSQGRPAETSDSPSVSELGPKFEAFVQSLQRPVVFFDTETTGTDPASDRIIEISLIRVTPEPPHIEPALTWRVNPGIRIPIESSRIHGIANTDVEDEPTFEQIADAVLAVVNGADLAGFNLGRFDARILQTELARVGREYDLSKVRMIDSQVIFHKREPRTLGAALQFYRGRELTNAHGALADTVATLEVFAGQLEKYDDLSTDVEVLHTLSSANNEAYCDSARRFAWRDDEPTFNFGKFRGRSLRWIAADPSERSYLRWILEGNFEEDAKLIVRDALEGRIRQRTVAPPPPKETPAPTGAPS
jgi:DNA polymerase-3 subunit epsilon